MKNTILIIGSIPPPFHGTNVFFENILKSSLNEQFKIKLMDIGEKRNDLSNFGKLDYYNIYYAIKNQFMLIHELIFFNPELIYICPSQGLAYFRDGFFILIAKAFGKINVEHLHGSNFMDFYYKSNLFTRWFIDFTQSKVDFSIVLSNSLQYNFTKWLDKKKIFVLPNGLQDYFKKNNYLKKKDGIKLLYLGNLYKFKGFLTVVECFGKICKKYSNLRLAIAGHWGNDSFMHMKENEIRNEYNRLLDIYELKSKIDFIGPVYGNKKHSLLSNSDIFIYPTYYDGFPYVILEAMSAGLPVITSKNVGGIDDMIINYKTGILTEKQNQEEIISSIEYLILNEDKRVEMGRHGRKRFLEEYTIDKHLEKLKEIFFSLLLIVHC